VVEEEVARGLAGVRNVTQNLKSVFEATNLRKKDLLKNKANQQQIMRGTKFS
jgi:hypothetical protein